MCDITLTLKSVVDTVAAVAREMAQEATDMKDKAAPTAEDTEQEATDTSAEAGESPGTAQDGGSREMPPGESSSGEGHVLARESDMSPISGESKLAASMEAQPMDSAGKKPVPDSCG